MQQIEYKPFIQTGLITKFLIGCRDQVSSTKDVAEHFNVPQQAVRDAMARLKRVNRVDEIHPNLWHLE